MTDAEEEGLWALHHTLDLVNQLATWPALPLDCPCEPISLFIIIYLSWFLLPTPFVHSCQASTSDVDLPSLCPRLPGGWILSHKGLVAPARDFPLCSISPILAHTYEIIWFSIVGAHKAHYDRLLPIPSALAHFPSLALPIVRVVFSYVVFQTSYCFMCLCSHRFFYFFLSKIPYLLYFLCFTPIYLFLTCALW